MQNVLDIYSEIEYHRMAVKELVMRDKTQIDERKRLVSEEWYKLILEVCDIPFPSFQIQIAAIKVLAEIFLEFKDYPTAIFYYNIAVRQPNLFILLEILCRNQKGI